MIRCACGLLLIAAAMAGGPSEPQPDRLRTPPVVVRVLRPDGAPAADAETFVWTRCEGHGRHWAGGGMAWRTDGDGRLEVVTTHLATVNGNDRLRADAVALVCPAVGWCVVSAEELHSPGGRAVEARLQPGCRVHVCRRAADGAPQPEQPVCVTGVPEWQIGSVSETRDTDAGGMATFGLLPPGLYEITAPDPGATGQHVLLAPGDEVEVDVWVGAVSQPAWPVASDDEPPACELAGCAIGADGTPLIGATVWIDLLPLDPSPTGCAGDRRAVTDGSGRFSFARVRSGYHTVAVLAEGRTVALHPLHVAANGEPEPVTIRAAPPTGRISGRVIEHGGEQGIPGAMVVALEQRFVRQPRAGIASSIRYNPKTGLPGFTSAGSAESDGDMAAVFTATTTDADGCYEIAGLLPGAYALAVRSAEGRDEAHPVFVAGNSVTQAPDLWLPRAEGLTVRVRLVSAAGEPLSGQAVEFTATSTPVGGHISARGPTDEAGVLVLSATCPGWYGFSLRCGDGSEAGCWGVPVTAQGQTTEPTLVARRPATCRAAVHVVATDGTPSAQRAWVFPVARQTEGGAGAADLCGALFTEADGVCTFTGLAPGSYVFVAQTPRGRGSDALGACMAVSPLVTIPPNGSADVTAVLETPVRLAGRVSGPDGATTGPFAVSAQSDCGLVEWPWLRSGTFTDRAGEFVLDGLYPGRWEVNAQSLEPAPHLWVQPYWTSPDPGGMAWVELTGRAPTEAADDPYDPVPLLVTGRVVRANGDPAPGAIVGWAETGASPAHQVLAGPGGEFHLPGVLGTCPRVFAWAPDGCSASRMLDTRGGQFPGRVTDPFPVELTLAPMPAITGWVVAPPGDPATGCFDVVAEARQLWDTSGPWPAGMARARVHADRDGTFVIEGLKPGEYSITAVWGTLRRTAPVVVNTFQGGVGGLLLTVEPLVPTLRLRLEDYRGRPLAPGQPLGVSVSGSRLAGAIATVDGWVELCQTPPGVYEVWPVALARDSTRVGSGDVTPLTSELSVCPPQWPHLRGRAIAAPGHRLHPGLRVALCSAGQWMESATYYWDIEPDGTYDVPISVAGEVEVCLVVGRGTRLAIQRLTLLGQARTDVTDVPDLVYAGLPSD